ncbi:hypothetical protein BACCIP111895_03947 [Neobacillus rhizosphaerae]|uniref:Uncharacterized protein n=1 Tax=Neobacillus rhizosphaerae TaxID=2880965 RepID=A0ABM9EVU1_9BACI|nr:hypothetical protein [Neobacillus rhizosphaerae]CAH2716759.1 hypothetical protein BACCIP111895_03947 [Neobacillus rhizosphaerae]
MLEGTVVLALLHYAITWPFAFLKYVFDRERPFWETWHDYAETLEKFTLTLSRIIFGAFILVIVYTTFV